MISKDVIEDIKYRNNIEDVISNYIALNRSGNNLKGLCPFHGERTPSFTVYTGNDSHFFCYGCGAGGDVVSFVMRAENLDYVSALEFLANRAGVTIPTDTSYNENTVSRGRVLKANLEAAKFYRSVLFSDQGKKGQEYFNKRQLSGSTIKRFGLGYAPDSFNALRNHLRKLGFSDEELIKSNLCQRSQKNPNNIYDVFRNRVMFPILDLSGNVVAFGGRVLDDSKPKYLNSSDTPAFKKSKTLFALNYAKNYCDDGIILCEGYMDVIALHAAGFQSAVAALGTAITSDHARLLKKYTNKVIICTDSDEAGRKAADKALRILSEVEIEARVITVPNAKDPDEYLKKYGALSFSEVLKNSKTKFEYKIIQITSKYDINDSAQKAQAARELCKEISNVYSSIEREIYMGELSKTLEINIESIKIEVNAFIKQNTKKTKKEDHDKLLRDISGIGNRVDPDYAKDVKASNIEYCLIGLLLYRNEYIQKISNDIRINESMFHSNLCKRLFNKMISCYKDGGFDFIMLNEDFTQEEISEAEKMIAKRREIKDNSENVLQECINKLLEEVEKRNLKENGNDILAVIEQKRKKENI